jgi:hypothetical protein
MMSLFSYIKETSNVFDLVIDDDNKQKEDGNNSMYVADYFFVFIDRRDQKSSVALDESGQAYGPFLCYGIWNVYE